MSDEYGTIAGHPSIILEGDPTIEMRRSRLTPWRQVPTVRENKIVITVCAECEKMSTVLFLDKDRWYCTNCRNEGAAAPTMVPITRPRGGSTNG